jgi:tRNA threonylcarbamoyl adenosine modification protein (Sua5/YciO/YrdC/YwlC family)
VKKRRGKGNFDEIPRLQQTGIRLHKKYLENGKRMLIPVNPDNPQPRSIRQIADKLRSGGVICYPTDTVYGIGCDIFNQKAVKKIFQIKKRPRNKPFSFMCSSLRNVSDYANVSNMAYRIMRKALPGPFTFVLPAAKIVPKIMITKQKTVGIRVPANNICTDLIAALGNPILTTSAILDEDQPLSEAYEFEELLGNVVDVVIDGGLVYPDPSTVIDFSGDEPEILRQGKGDISLFYA